MDFFLAICQALGIALAVGALAGAVWPRDANPSALLLTAAVLGAVGAALSISADDESVIAGVVAGAIGGPLAAAVVASLVAGAARRAETGAGGPGVILIIAALILAGLSILLPPISLAALLGLGWLAVARRRRAERKYEGLRILR